MTSNMYEIKFVIKRDGTFSPFELEKITNAIHGAATATEEFGISESNR